MPATTKSMEATIIQNGSTNSLTISSLPNFVKKILDLHSSLKKVFSWIRWDNRIIINNGRTKDKLVKSCQFWFKPKLSPIRSILIHWVPKSCEKHQMNYTVEKISQHIPTFPPSESGQRSSLDTLALSSSANSFWMLSLGDGFPALKEAPWATERNKHLPSPGMPAAKHIKPTSHEKRPWQPSA